MGATTKAASVFYILMIIRKNENEQFDTSLYLYTQTKRFIWQEPSQNQSIVASHNATQQPTNQKRRPKQ